MRIASAIAFRKLSSPCSSLASLSFQASKTPAAPRSRRHALSTSTTPPSSSELPSALAPPQPATGAPVVELPKSVDIAIVGGGVMGLHLAYQLLQRVEKGTTVHVFERAPGVGYGSSGSSSAVLRCFYSLDPMIKFARAGLDDYVNWPEYLQLPSSELSARVVTPGLLSMNPMPRREAEARAKHYREECNVPIEVLSAKQVEERWPALSLDVAYFDNRGEQDYEGPKAMEEDERVLYETEAGYFDPVQSLADVRSAIARHFGATGQFQLHFSCEVDKITHKGGRATAIEVTRRKTKNGTGKKNGQSMSADGLTVLQAESKTISCGTIINCNGPWFERLITSKEKGLADALDIKLDIGPVTAEVIYKNAPAVFATPESRKPTKQRDFQIPICGDPMTGIYFRPQTSSHQILAGSMRGDDEQDRVENPDDITPDLGASPETRTRLLSSLFHRIKPEFLDPNAPGASKVQSLCSMYTVCHSDHHPIIGPSKLQGLYLANGFSGHGFKIATQVGRSLARLITGVRKDGDAKVDMDFFSPYRTPHNLAVKNVFA